MVFGEGGCGCGWLGRVGVWGRTGSGVSVVVVGERGVGGSGEVGGGKRGCGTSRDGTR